MASVVVNGDTSGAVTLSAPAVAGTVTVTLPSTSGTMAVLPTATGVLAESAGGTGTTTGYYGFKNRVFNGAMVIDQRNAGASVTPTVTSYPWPYSVDRWSSVQTQASKFSIQQNAGSVTPPAGFVNYLGVTVGASANVTVGAADLFMLLYRLEGYSIADLNFGSANANTTTLSFWVRSSLTGTFGGTLASGTDDYLYPFSYTIAAANTWQKVTVTVTGPTQGTYSTTNGYGLSLCITFGAGSNSIGTPGAWTTSGKYAPTGQTNLISTNSATFYVTGVQFESGATATSFDYRPYGTELALCQRYFEQSYDYGTVAGAATGLGSSMTGGPVGGATTSYIEGPGYFKVTKRATPTMLCWDSSGNANKCARILSGSSATVNSVAALGTIGTNVFSMNSGGSANANVMQIQWTASSEL